jgi:hypothetical protein
VATTERMDPSSFGSTVAATITASNASLDQKLAQDEAGPSLITDVPGLQEAVQSQSTPAILWQNSDGQASIWDMSANTLVSGGLVSPNPGPGWTEIGAGDFYDDGHSDILWRNASTGQASIWGMNGDTIAGGGPVTPNFGPGWRAGGLT